MALPKPMGEQMAAFNDSDDTSFAADRSNSILNATCPARIRNLSVGRNASFSESTSTSSTVGKWRPPKREPVQITPLPKIGEVPSRKRSTSATSDKHSDYKTRLCDAFQRQGWCPYNNYCTYAHGEVELQVPIFPVKMAENKEVNMNNKVKRSDEVAHILLKNLHDLMIKNQDEQKLVNEEVLEKLRLSEKSIKQLSDKQQKIANTISEKSSGTVGKQENKPIEKSIDNEVSDAFSEKHGTPTAILPTAGKSFVLKHVFNNVSSMGEKKEYYSKVEDHLGVPWEICVTREDNCLAFFLYCPKSLNKENWSIESNFELKLISKSGNHVTKKLNKTFGNADGNMEYHGFGKRKIVEWEKLNDGYVNDDKLTTEIHVHITKMTGIYKDDLKIFDESMAKFSDVILIVKERKFYVLKLFLAANSPYFESLFMGQFQESGKSEITLSGIDDDDFQKYLEVLYGENSIDETTIEGILLVADMYETPIAIRKCQEFLLEKSKKTLKKKLEMSARYNLEQMKNKCMLEIKTIDDIKSVLPGNIDDMDHSIIIELFKKSLEFQ